MFRYGTVRIADHLLSHRSSLSIPMDMDMDRYSSLSLIRSNLLFPEDMRMSISLVYYLASFTICLNTYV